jgi:hypothetical protein
MTGFVFCNARKWPISVALIGAMGLTACDDSGNFAFPTAAEDSAATLDLPANAPNQTVQVGRDVERPDIFEVTDRGLWDGRPSLGGVWVAHPDVQDPERVVIRNGENGRSIVGALFRRERENPGPLLQVSSDAADELGILPGAPTELTVVVLRREEVDVDAPPEVEVNPVVASLAAPVSIESAALDPADASDAAATETAAAAVAPAAAVLPAAVEAATAAIEQTAAAGTSAASDAIDISAVLAPAPEAEPEPAVPVTPLADGTTAQVGIFSVEANAGAAAQRIMAAGLQATVLAEEIGGRTVWRVVAGPLADTGELAQLKSLGYVDAFITEDAE